MHWLLLLPVSIDTICDAFPNVTSFMIGRLRSTSAPFKKPISMSARPLCFHTPYILPLRPYFRSSSTSSSTIPPHSLRILLHLIFYILLCFYSLLSTPSHHSFLTVLLLFNSNPPPFHVACLPNRLLHQIQFFIIFHWSSFFSHFLPSHSSGMTCTQDRQRASGGGQRGISSLDFGNILAHLLSSSFFYQ